MAKKTGIFKLFGWVIAGFGILIGLAGTVGFAADTPASLDAATLSQDWKLNATIIMQLGPQAYDEKSILVKFEPGLSKAARKALAQSVGGSYMDRNDDGVDDCFDCIADGRWAKISLSQTGNAGAISSALMVLDKQPGITFVQLNTRVSEAKIPNDTEYSKQWAMTKIQAPQAWEKTTGSRNVVVGVLDSGVNYTHPDLKANMWKNPKEIAGNGKDDDNNGYVDDVYGISAFNDSGDPSDPIMWQHGTHVAGIIGAAGNNRFAVAGVNWKVSIMALRFFDNAGQATDADAVECINYALGLKKAGVNLKVLNASVQSPNFNQMMLDAIKDTEQQGILFVAAAGNGGWDTSYLGTDNDLAPVYPASYDSGNVMAIAATDRMDQLPDYSNFGARTVDMGAPGGEDVDGEGILSTWWWDEAPPDQFTKEYHGTSFATPHVAGGAALMLSRNPNLSYAELKQILMGSGDSIPALDGKTVSGKRLNLKEAIDQVPMIELLKNSGFEQGARYWRGSTGAINSGLGRQKPFEGTKMAFLGGNGRASHERIYQDVTIPASATSATLSFWLHIDTSEPKPNYIADMASVEVLDTRNNRIALLGEWENGSQNVGPGYHLFAYDLSEYKGQTIRISLSMTENESKQTSFVFDNVRLAVRKH